MDKLRSAALLAACSTTLSGPVLGQADSHPLLSTVVCNKSGKFPKNGARATIVNVGHHLSLSLTKPDAACGNGLDGTAVGGKISCFGYPAQRFSCVVSGAKHNEPTFSVVVALPFGGQETLTNVPYQKTGGTGAFRANVNIENLVPAGSKFEAIYIWDEDAPENIQITGFWVDSVPVVPDMRVSSTLTCTGINPPDDCGS